MAVWKRLRAKLAGYILLASRCAAQEQQFIPTLCLNEIADECVGTTSVEIIRAREPPHLVNGVAILDVRVAHQAGLRRRLGSTSRCIHGPRSAYH